jgi:carbamoyl-phosphate synthase/aspartate carbamoyltransferase/dihydroorotase
VDPLVLPGLVDIHVHLRDPGQTHKEDFSSGTAAALAGGFTTVVDMPNNAVPVTDEAVLDQKLGIAASRVVCDTGVYFGSLGDNLDLFPLVQDRVRGLKLYLNHTTGGYLLDTGHLVKIFDAWRSPKPVLVHAEADVIGPVLDAARVTGQAVHVCHVSSRAELEPVLEARSRGVAVSCGVTPHHLFLCDRDAARLGPLGEVRPALRPEADVRFLWQHLAEIDVVESDHAPHTLAEKHRGSFGFPGLETTLPLLLHAERQGRLRMDDIIAKCVTGPRRVLGLPLGSDSRVEVDPVEFEIDPAGMRSRAGWTPFAGMRGVGRVRRVTVRGVEVLRDGEVVAVPGTGTLI